MSITETNIKTIRFFNNNIRKLDQDIIKSITILEELHYNLYGIYIKLEKEKFLNIILTTYKELIYNKLFINNTNNQDNDWYFMELKKLICQSHLDNHFERIDWYLKSQFSIIFNKMRIDKTNNEINDKIKEIIKKHHEYINTDIDIKIEELRDEINYDINMKLENYEDIIDEKMKNLKLSLISNSKKKSYLMHLLLTIISITTIINFYY